MPSRKSNAAFLAQNPHSGGYTQCSHAVDAGEGTICSVRGGWGWGIANHWSKLSLAMRRSQTILHLNLSSQGWARMNHFLLCWKDARVFQENSSRAHLFTGWTRQVYKACPKWGPLWPLTSAPAPQPKPLIYIQSLLFWVALDSKHVSSFILKAPSQT